MLSKKIISSNKCNWLLPRNTFYFIKTIGISYEYINYSELDNKELVNRTNNYIDIHRYLKYYRKKYKCNLDIIHIIQGNSDEQSNISKVCNTILEYLLV